MKDLKTLSVALVAVALFALGTSTATRGNNAEAGCDANQACQGIAAGDSRLRVAEATRREPLRPHVVQKPVVQKKVVPKSPPKSQSPKTNDAQAKKKNDRPQKGCDNAYRACQSDCAIYTNHTLNLGCRNRCSSRWQRCSQKAETLPATEMYAARLRARAKTTARAESDCT